MKLLALFIIMYYVKLYNETIAKRRIHVQSNRKNIFNSLFYNFYSVTLLIVVCLSRGSRSLSSFFSVCVCVWSDNVLWKLLLWRVIKKNRPICPPLQLWMQCDSFNQLLDLKSLLWFNRVGEYSIWLSIGVSLDQATDGFTEKLNII